MNSRADRLVAALAGVAGLAGVALSAIATHAGLGPDLDVAARFLLIHAAALLAGVALIGSGTVGPRTGRIALAIMLVGLALFAGDLSVRAFFRVPLAPMAAPTGGLLLMAGWLGLAVAALVSARR